MIWRKLYLNSRNRFFAFYLFRSFQKTWILNLKRRVMSTDITLRSKLKVKEDLTSKYLLKRQTTMDYFIAIYLSTRSWIRSQSSDKGLISKYRWFWEIIKNELRLFWKAKWTRSKIHKKTLNHKIWSCFYSSLWISYDSDFFVCFHNQTRCKGYCRAQSQLNSFAMQITNSL